MARTIALETTLVINIMTTTTSEIAKDSLLEEESKISARLDDILSQLQAADDRIAKDRQDTVRLGQETKVMLTDLRKQLG